MSNQNDFKEAKIENTPNKEILLKSKLCFTVTVASFWIMYLLYDPSLQTPAMVTYSNDNNFLQYTHWLSKARV